MMGQITSEFCSKSHAQTIVKLNKSGHCRNASTWYVQHHACTQHVGLKKKKLKIVSTGTGNIVRGEQNNMLEKKAHPSSLIRIIPTSGCGLIMHLVPSTSYPFSPLF